MDFDGSIISSILPPNPIKADLRVSQIQAANDVERKFKLAQAIIKAKIARSLQVLDFLAERYDIQKQVQLAKREAMSLARAETVSQIRTVEGRTALRYWEAFAGAMPETLGFQGRLTTSHNNNASDPVNAALNYGYGFLKILCRTAINSVGLEPAVGFLHETASAQTAESLVFDLEELFRWLVDLCVIQAFETRTLTPHDFIFTKDDYLYRMTWESRMRFRDLLIEAFNSGVEYEGQTLKWDTVVEAEALKLARYLKGSSRELDFTEPAPKFERQDTEAVREKILSMTSEEAKQRGIGKSTLHYLRKHARGEGSFRIYGKVLEKIDSK